MDVNLNIYKQILRYTVDGANQDGTAAQIVGANNLYEMVDQNLLPFGSAWDSSNIYTQINPQLNNLEVGGTRPSTITFTTNEGQWFTGVNSAPASFRTVNLRLGIHWQFTSDMITRWTNQDSGMEVKIGENVNSTYQNPYHTREEALRWHLSNRGSNATNFTPIVSLDAKTAIMLIDRLVWFDVASQSVVMTSADDYRPASEGVDAGPLYSQSIWETGYDQNLDRYLIGVSYKTYYGRIESNTYDEENGSTGNLYRSLSLNCYNYNSGQYYQNGNTPIGVYCEAQVDGSLVYYGYPGFIQTPANENYGVASGGFAMDSDYLVSAPESAYNFSESTGYATSGSNWSCTEDNYRLKPIPISDENQHSEISMMNYGSFSNTDIPSEYPSSYIIEEKLIYYIKSGQILAPFVRWSLKQVYQAFATILLPFTSSVNCAERATLTTTSCPDPRMLIGITDDNSNAIGDWVSGMDVVDQPVIQRDDFIDPDYEPSEPGDVDVDTDDPSATPNDPGKREDKIVGDSVGSEELNRVVPNSGIQYFVMTGTEMLRLRSLVWAQTKDFYSALNIINTEGTDTIFNYISSLRYYPFSDITTFIETSSIYNRVVMGTGATIQNTAITPYTDFTLRVAENSFFQTTLCYWNLSDLPWRNNFLDFTPYSKLVVSIPYCGDVELDLNRVAAFRSLSQTRLYLKACGDIDSGTITFNLFSGATSDDYVYEQILYSKSVKVAIDLPLSGNDQITQSNAILQATYNQASKVLSVGSSLISSTEKTAGKLASHTANVGDVASFAADAIQGVMDIGIASAEASLAKRQVPVSIGDINGAIATTIFRQYPYLTLYRQKTANPANYGHTTGFVCEAAYTLSQLSGFTVLSNPDLSIVQGATQEELSELMGILTTGFYI